MYAGQDLTKHRDFVDNTAVPAEAINYYIMQNDGHEAIIVSSETVYGYLYRPPTMTPIKFHQEFIPGSFISGDRIAQM